MHYKNGREAKLGDPVVGRVGSNVIAGTIVSMYPGATSCNVSVSTRTLQSLGTGVQTLYQTTKLVTDADGKSHLLGDGETTANCDQLVHAEDAMAAIDKAVAAAIPPTPDTAG